MDGPRTISKQYVGQFAEPGVIAELAQAPGAAALLTDDDVASPIKDGVSCGRACVVSSVGIGK